MKEMSFKIEKKKLKNKKLSNQQPIIREPMEHDKKFMKKF